MRRTRTTSSNATATDSVSRHAAGPLFVPLRPASISTWARSRRGIRWVSSRWGTHASATAEAGTRPGRREGVLHIRLPRPGVAALTMFQSAAGSPKKTLTLRTGFFVRGCRRGFEAGAQRETWTSHAFGCCGVRSSAHGHRSARSRHLQRRQQSRGIRMKVDPRSAITSRNRCDETACRHPSDRLAPIGLPVHHLRVHELRRTVTRRTASI